MQNSRTHLRKSKTLKHLKSWISTFFGITLFAFLLFQIAIGDPALHLSGKNSDSEQIQMLRNNLDLDVSYSQQYLKFLKQTLTLNFGNSWTSQQPVTQMIIEALGPTLSLMLPAFTLSVLFSLTLALWTTLSRHSLLEKTITNLSFILLSMSSILYIVGLQYFFTFKNNWFPISGWSASLFERWSFLILPIIIYVVISFAHNFLIFKSLLYHEGQKDYVRTAKSKGLSSFVILTQHIFKNTTVSILTVLVQQIPFLVLGSLLIESFFSLPGLGSLVFQAIQTSDIPILKAVTILIATLYLSLQTLLDFLVPYLMPQTKASS